MAKDTKTPAKCNYPEPSEESQNKKRRNRNRRAMAWVAIVTMIIVTMLAFFFVDPTRLDKLADVITWFYFTMASIVLGYMGFTTLPSLKK